MDGVSTVMRTVPALKDMPPGANHVRDARGLHRKRGPDSSPHLQAQQEEAKRRRVAQATALKENMEP